jgi:hypothetical protein
MGKFDIILPTDISKHQSFHHPPQAAVVNLTRNVFIKESVKDEYFQM